ncbi:MAG: ABC transporter permease [Chloroflexi bacterium]|nr:ABC transporter permease [Chloroflexota bacterium]
MASNIILNPNEEWDMIIRPQRAWWDLRLGDLWRYRDLIWLLVWRDFVAAYKQTILGPLWYLISPIISSVVFTVIFSNVAKLPTDGLPPFLFYMAGNTIWGYFASCLTSTSNTFVANAGIFGKVYFPRLIIPISVVISNLISFGIRFGVFVLFLLYFLFSGSDLHPNLYILLLPVLLIVIAGTGLGLGVIASSLTTKYRDLQQLLGFGVQLIMYASPVIYPLSTVPANWRWLLLANPMTPIIEIFRYSFLGVSSLEPVYLFYSAVFMFVVLLIGVLIFNRVENTFMDTV